MLGLFFLYSSAWWEPEFCPFPWHSTMLALSMALSC